MLAALADERWSGPFNATAPDPVSNRELSKLLGRVLGRPAFAPVPAFALRARYGAMAEIITGGARVLPAKALVLGYEFAYPELEPALRAALGA
jgi:NAD dependent epimerase/dehydratase family enzyme